MRESELKGIQTDGHREKKKTKNDRMQKERENKVHIER